MKVNILSYQTNSIVKACESLVTLVNGLTDLNRDCNYLLIHVPSHHLFHYLEWLANGMFYCLLDCEHLQTGRIFDEEHENEIKTSGWLFSSKKTNNDTDNISIMSIKYYKSEVLKMIDSLGFDIEGSSNFRTETLVKILALDMAVSEAADKLDNVTNDITALFHDCKFFKVVSFSLPSLSVLIEVDVEKGIEKSFVFNEEYFLFHERYNRRFTRQHLLRGIIPDPGDNVGSTKEYLFGMMKEQEIALQFSRNAVCVFFEREEFRLKKQRTRLSNAYLCQTTIKRSREEDV